LDFATWVVGGEAEISTVDFDVEADTMVTVPAGTFMCKHLHYEYSSTFGDSEYHLYYETSLGILVKSDFQYDDDLDPYYDISELYELKSSNMNIFLPLGLPPQLFLIVIVVIVIVIIVVVIILVYFLVIRKRGS
jgi:hypothetical protein